MTHDQNTPSHVSAAADTIYRTVSGHYGGFSHHVEAAEALNNERRLLPDLPGPVIDSETGGSSWAGGSVTQNWGGVEIDLSRYSVSDRIAWLAPDEARRFAYGVLAAIELIGDSPHK